MIVSLNHIHVSQVSRQQEQQANVNVIFNSQRVYGSFGKGQNIAKKIISKKHFQMIGFVVNPMSVATINKNITSKNSAYIPWNILPFESAVNYSLNCFCIPRRNGFTARLGLTHCGIVTPYGEINIGQHWLVAWRHKVIAWTNVGLSPMNSVSLIRGQFHRHLSNYQFIEQLLQHFLGPVSLTISLFYTVIGSLTSWLNWSRTTQLQTAPGRCRHFKTGLQCIGISPVWDNSKHKKVSLTLWRIYTVTLLLPNIYFDWIWIIYSLYIMEEYVKKTCQCR